MSFRSNVSHLDGDVLSFGNVLLEVRNGRLVVVIDDDPGTIVGPEGSGIFLVEMLSNLPPASPTIGKFYAVGSEPLGDWSHQAGKVAYYTTEWIFITVQGGSRLLDKQNNTGWVHDGSLWIQEALDPDTVKEALAGASDSNIFTDEFRSKLSGIEENATGDMTSEEVASLISLVMTDGENDGVIITYDPDANRFNFTVDVSEFTDNNFTNELKNKLDGIEDGAEVNPSASEVKIAYESNANTNAFTDELKNKLDGIEDGAEVNLSASETSSLISSTITGGNNSGVTVTFENGVFSFEVDAQTDNNFTNILKAKLDNIEAGATGDMTGDEISSLISTNITGGDNSGILVSFDPVSETYSFEVVVQTDNNFTNELKNKLDGIEDGAEVNPSASEIKIAYESNANTNAFTDIEKSKLSGIEAGAEVNPTASEVKIAYESNANTNAFTDELKNKLDGIEDGAEVNPSASEIKIAYESNANTNAFTDDEKSKLAGITPGATGDMSGERISDLLETHLTGGSNSGITVTYDTGANAYSFEVVVQTDNNFTNELKNKLDGIEDGAEVNPTASEIKIAYESNANTNAFTDELKNKLDSIEAGATGDMTGGEIASIIKDNITEGSNSGISISFNVSNDTFEFSVDPQTDNNFTDILKNKLDGIEVGATGDMSASEVASLISSNITGGDNSGITITYNSNTNRYSFIVASQTDNNFTDILKNKLDGIENGAEVNLNASETSSLISPSITGGNNEGVTVTYEDGTFNFVLDSSGITDNNFTDELKNKLDGIEEGAEVNLDGAGILEALVDVQGSGSGLDADKLDGLESSAFALAAHNHNLLYEPVRLLITQGDAIAGSSTAVNSWTSQRVRQNVAAYASPLGHTHGMEDITNLLSVLSLKSDIGHHHDASDIIGLDIALGNKVNVSDYIGSQILTKLKTVDGTGSGLDADLLDGLDSSNFALAVHSHSIASITNLQTTLNNKLNTSNYTAADIITKLKTVDGTGSGLDADLLDGLHASAFLRLAETNTLTGSLTVGAGGSFSVGGIEFLFNGEDTVFDFNSDTSGLILQGYEVGTTNNISIAEFLPNSPITLFHNGVPTFRTQPDMVQVRYGGNWRNVAVTGENIQQIFGGDIVIDGNLTVTGQTTTSETEELNVATSFITLNFGVEGEPTLNASINVDRGFQPNATLQWDESLKIWVAGVEEETSRILLASDMGHGNELDADKLDGHHGSYYQNASNLNSGTVDSLLIPDLEISKITGLSAALGTKLDSSSYTASDVLSKLLTVDGTGSGLDADLLDGQHASAFALVEHNHSDVYEPLRSTVEQAEAEAGSATTVRGWTSQRVRQNVAAYASPIVHNHSASEVTSGSFHVDRIPNLSISKITSLQSSLDGKSDIAHGHGIGDIFELEDALGAKLDSSSYTASDVLSKLLTVDGTGSGLDADLLDGQHASAFASASHNHSAGDVTSGSFHVDRIPNLSISKITGLVDALSGKQEAGSYEPLRSTVGQVEAEAGSSTTIRGWSSLRVRQNVAAYASPIVHNHSASEVTSGSFHVDRIPNLSISKITGLVDALSGKQEAGSYEPLRSTVGQVEAEAGSATTVRGWTSQRVRQNVAAYASPLNHGHEIEDISGLADDIASKLDSASYTASDVLSKLLTVDGESSGLDADLLDGQHASAFALVGHNHSDVYEPLRSTVDQAEAEAGSSTTIRGWSSLRVRQNVAAYAAPLVHSHAISSVTGLEDALDGKLDSTSYTASDVLTKLKTVDGTGSGLDADLLDGQHASAFASASHNHSASEVTSGSFHVDRIPSLEISKITGLSAALGNKLDSSSYTASDVLSKLLTVDGEGSGLDADTVDGKHANDFALVAHDHSGTYEPARTIIGQAEAEAGSATTVRGWTSQRVRQNVAAYASPLGHGHSMSDVTGLEAALNDKVDIIDYTGTEILSKLSLVDGTGSGLDADLLDGQHASAFASASHNHSGVYDPAKATVSLEEAEAGTSTTLRNWSSLRVRQNVAAYAAPIEHDHTMEEVDGLSSALGAKLDVSAYTAADVLTKLKTVDGTGSGLDADLLDGQSGDYYSTRGSWGGISGTMSNQTDLQEALDDKWNISDLPATAFGKSLLNASSNITARALLGGSANLPEVTQGVAEAGTSTESRMWSSLRVRQNVAAYAAPLTHSHVISNITGLQDELDGKLGASAKAADSSLLNGYAEDTSGTANTIVRRDSNGDIFTRYFGFTASASTRNSDTIFYSSTDNFIRKNTAAGFKASLGLATEDISGLQTALDAKLPSSTPYFTGQMTAQVGSAAAPSYSFVSSPDAGMYRIGSNRLGFATAGALRLEVANAGVIVTGSVTASGDITAFSDKRLKKNIKTISNAVDRVQRLRGVSFDWKKTGRASIGVIAQEVQKVMPEVVGETDDGTLTVAYGNLVGVLIEAVKELDARVRELEAA